MKVHEAAKLAIKHECFDGQDPYTCIEATMMYHPCTMTVHIKHRGIVLLITIVVEPVMASVLQQALKGMRPYYMFARAIRVQTPEQVEVFLNELREAGLEFTLV